MSSISPRSVLVIPCLGSGRGNWMLMRGIGSFAMGVSRNQIMVRHRVRDMVQAGNRNFPFSQDS